MFDIKIKHQYTPTQTSWGIKGINMRHNTHQNSITQRSLNNWTIIPKGGLKTKKPYSNKIRIIETLHNTHNITAELSSSDNGTTPRSERHEQKWF
jgi:hypothetical protein